MKYIHIGGIMLLSLAFTGVWMLTQETTVSTGTSGLSGVLKNPIDFIVRMFGTFFGSHTVEYYDQLVGHKIDYNEISCNAWFYVFATFAMIVALMIRNTETIKIKKIDRLLSNSDCCDMSNIFRCRNSMARFCGAGKSIRFQWEIFDSFANIRAIHSSFEQSWTPKEN